MTGPDLKMTVIRVYGIRGEIGAVRRNRASSLPQAPAGGTEVLFSHGSVTRVAAPSLQQQTHPSRQIGPLR